MTELMKRYEEETRKEAETRVTAIFQGTSRKIMFFTDEYVEWLEALLTWRDVREKPEENDLYICKFHDNGESKIYMDTYEWKNGKWIVDYDEIIVGWLPIPKENIK